MSSLIIAIAIIIGILRVEEMVVHLYQVWALHKHSTGSDECFEKYTHVHWMT